MTIRHHVGDDLIVAYAAGGLEESWSLVVATHLALCGQCRTAVRRAEELGGVLIDGLEPASLGDDALSTAMARIDAGKPVDRKLDDLPRVKRVRGPVKKTILPEPLRSYAGGDLEQLTWRRLGPNAHHISLSVGPGQVRLLRIPAGKPVPEHSHDGRELILVLKGSFRDERGEYHRGDIEDCDETVQHKPIAGNQEDCVCLAITEAPLRFKGLAARLAQPFMGI